MCIPWSVWGWQPVGSVVGVALRPPAVHAGLATKSSSTSIHGEHAPR